MTAHDRNDIGANGATSTAGAGSAPPAARNSTARPAGRGRHRRARRAVWLLAAAWVAWYAYARLTKVPPAYQDNGLARVAEAQDKIDALYDVLQGLPALTSLPNPRPYDGDQLAHALPYRWAPGSPNVNAIRQHLSQPAVATRLDELHRLCADVAALTPGMPVRWEPEPAGGTWMLAPPSRRDMTNLYKRAIVTLTARGRLRIERDRDFAAAMEDFKAALRLERYQRRFQNPPKATWFHDEETATPPVHELGFLAREHAFPPAIAADLIRFIEDETATTVADELRDRAGLPPELDAFLDWYYTDIGRDRGWLVLSHTGPALELDHYHLGWQRLESALPRHSAWNLLSLPFHSRAATRAKIDQHLARAVEELATQPIDHSLPIMRSHAILPTTGCRDLGFTVPWPSDDLAGPAARVLARLRAQGSDIPWRVAERHALVVILALSAHRHKHDRLPATLDALPPDFLAAVPRDSLTNEPYVYITSKRAEELNAEAESPEDFARRLWHSRLDEPYWLGLGAADDRPRHVDGRPIEALYTPARDE